MLNETMLEQRLEAVEHAVAELRSRMANGAKPSDWVERVTGSVTDEEAFREVLKFGRAFREADRPADDSADEP
jgi:hypothetical protein